MKTSFALLTLLAPLVLTSSAVACPTAWHEFDIFGRERIYLSHLAAFHSIHGYQAVVEVELDPASADLFRHSKYARARLSPTAKGKKGEQLTDRLEDWRLPPMMKEGKEFHAEIHAGPTQEMVAADVTVKIKRVVHFEMYRDGAPRPPELPYLMFGTASETFLVHAMTDFPDFDQILAVETKGPAIPDGTTRVVFPGTDNLPHPKVEGGKKTYTFHPLKVGDEKAAGAWTYTVKSQLRFNNVDREY